MLQRPIEPAMPLFPSVTLSKHHRAPNEPFWEFVCRYDSDYTNFMRPVVDAWFDAYPRSEQPDLASRMRSGAADFHAGCAELFTFQLLARLCTRPSVIPRVANTKTPDFRARAVGGDVIVETRRTADTPPNEWRSIATVRRALTNGAAGAPPDVTLVIHRNGAFSAIPKAGPISGAVHDFLESPEVQQYCTAKRAGQKTTPPILNLPLGGTATISVFPFVRPASAIRAERIEFWSDTPDAPEAIGASNTAETPDTVRAIRRAVRQKSSRYGELNCPYVVSLTVHGEGGWILDNAIERALYGDGTDRSMVGRRNGLWNSTQNTRLSGVIVTQNIVPAPKHRGYLKLYLNPWAAHPVPYPLTRIERVEVSSSDLVDIPGRTMFAIFKTNHPGRWCPLWCPIIRAIVGIRTHALGRVARAVIGKRVNRNQSRRRGDA